MNLNQLQPAHIEKLIPFPERTLLSRAVRHHPQIKRGLEEIRALFRDDKVVDQDARVASFEGGSSVAEELKASAVGSAVENGAEEVVAGVCDAPKKRKWE